MYITDDIIADLNSATKAALDFFSVRIENPSSDSSYNGQERNLALLLNKTEAIHNSLRNPDNGYDDKYTGSIAADCRFIARGPLDIYPCPWNSSQQELQNLAAEVFENLASCYTILEQHQEGFQIDANTRANLDALEALAKSPIRALANSPIEYKIRLPKLADAIRNHFSVDVRLGTKAEKLAYIDFKFSGNQADLDARAEAIKTLNSALGKGLHANTHIFINDFHTQPHQASIVETCLALQAQQKSQMASER